MFGKNVGEADARARVAQGTGDFLGIVADSTTTMPIPVTTTRLIRHSLVACPADSCSGRLGQSDPQIDRLVDGFAIGLQPAIGNTEDQAAAHDAFEVDAVFDLLDRRASPCP